MSAIELVSSADVSTNGCGLSTREDSQQTGNPRVESTFSAVMLLLAAIAAIVCISLTVRCYMRCPWLDEWQVIADIGRGASPWSWHWLWSQHGEHRVAMARLLIWLDWAAFGAKNVSLFVETYLVQLVHLGAICYAVERFTEFPKSLKRMLEGVFAFCLFNPYQAQNLTWAFQVSFVLPFAIGTIALLGLAFIERVPARWRRLTLLAIGLAPLFAAMNLAAGLFIGPAGVALACLKRVSRRAILALGTSSLTSFLLYLWGYHSPAGHSSPLQSLVHPGDIVRYVFTLLDTGWHFLWIGGFSLLFLGGCLAAAWRYRARTSNFEWFCIAGCGFTLMTAASIACGRLQYGIAQAGESRYQTVAMIYWASIFSLALIRVWRWQPARIGLLQMAIVLVTLFSLLWFSLVFRGFTSQADLNRQACASVTAGKYDQSTVKRLDFFVEDPAGEIRRAMTALRAQWVQ